MKTNRLYSPLRYPGGKASFSPFIAKVMELMVHQVYICLLDSFRQLHQLFKITRTISPIHKQVAKPFSTKLTSHSFCKIERHLNHSSIVIGVDSSKCKSSSEY